MISFLNNVIKVLAFMNDATWHYTSTDQQAVISFKQICTVS